MNLPWPLSLAWGHLSLTRQLLDSFPGPWASWLPCLSELSPQPGTALTLLSLGYTTGADPIWAARVPA